MSNDRINVYEGLFLFPHHATADLKSAVDHVQEILARAEAEVISIRKWDERRMAYEIKGNKRGVYLLVYFRAAGGKMSTIERDCNLSEQLLRSMVIRADHLTPAQIEAADGRRELDDEIRLRGAEGEKAAPAAAAAAPESADKG